ncbi:NIPSNAP family protein [Ramlibacter humi]|uniref:NIPSNAP family protein n=1 Tax=Ramlibacter humi TaxID=2530451 RepID=A0A4Z0CEJ7_9BURK|nr:NIPSNAP family protein [Ramlibacter humi]TFZ08865.1 NIPSNAP family protein [Ramlibacter humi]
MTATAPTTAEAAIVELRQYTLHPGRRDELVTLFDREFVEPQEALGMKVMGQFRDLDAPDRFVWLRGFRDRAARLHGLQSFYGGPVWAKHRDAANATMIDSDDVLLLRPAWPGAELRLREPRGDGNAPATGLLDAAVFHLARPADEALLQLARGPLSACLETGGALWTAWYVTDTTPNDFPRLPVREGTKVLAGFALFPDAAAFDAFAASGRWSREAAPLLAPWLQGAPELRRLAPTSRSAIRA